MNNNDIEIERKFILKNVPKFNRKEIEKFIIHQIYLEIDGVVNRFRMTEDMGKDGDNRVYHHCIKTPISEGKFKEVERIISKEKFKEMFQKEHRYIIKTRYVYEKNGFKWEIDKYNEIYLVVLEVEFINDYDFENFNKEKDIPEIIKEQLITEVTGQTEFSNYSLSIKEEM